MSWTRSSSVPRGGSGPRALRLDQEGQEGHGRDRAGHDGRDLRRGDERALPNGSDGQRWRTSSTYEANMEGLCGKNWM